MNTETEMWAPAEVFPPGEFLSDALENLGWTQTEFAKLIRRPTQLINEIIAGKRSITATTAKEIAEALGTSPEYWLNLESAYQLSKAPEASPEISREALLRKRFPVREMRKRGWIPETDSLDEVERHLLGFFGIPDIGAPLEFAHAARRNYEQSLTELQWSWIYRVKQLATALQAPRYSEGRLREALPDMERLMIDPQEIRHLPRLLNEAGVRFVIVEPIPGSKIHGVCFWLDEHAPVIGLTLKGDYIDRVWFNVRHEIEHVLRGDGKDGAPIVDDFEEDSDNAGDAAEIAANAAAAEFCVPQKLMRSFIIRHAPMFSTKSFIGFSRIVKRHPGIVAGQLQHSIQRPELFRKYQTRVRAILIQTALTDGYGQSAPASL